MIQDRDRRAQTRAHGQRHGSRRADRRPAACTRQRRQVSRLLAWAARWPDRRWAVEGAAGTGAAAGPAAGRRRPDGGGRTAPLAARVRPARHRQGGEERRRRLGCDRGRRLRRCGLRDVAAPAGRPARPALRPMRPHGEPGPPASGRPGRWRRVAQAVGQGRRQAGRPARARGRGRVGAQADRPRPARRRHPLGRQVKDIHRRIREAVAASGTTLTELFGVGPITAAMVIAHSGDPTRSPVRVVTPVTTAPVEAFSGDVRRHRLGRGGNRQLNRALHIVAVAQIRHATDGRAYRQRKLDERKPRKRRCGRSNGSCPTSPTGASSTQNGNLASTQTAWHRGNRGTGIKVGR